MRIPLSDYWRLLRQYLAPQQWAVLLMAALLLTSIGLQLVGPQVARRFIDAARTGTDEQQLIALALWFIGLSIVQTVLVVLATYWSERVAWTATNALRADLAAHLVRLDLSFHKLHSPGELIERVDGDVQVLAGFFSSFVVQLLGSALLLGGVLVAVYLIDARLGAAFLAFAVLGLLLLVSVRRFGTRHWHADREHSAAFYGYVGEVLAATEDIRSSGAVPYALRRLLAQLRDWWPAKWWASLWGQSVMTSAIALFAVADAIAYGLGGNLYQSQTISLGTVYLLIAYVAMLAAPIETIRTQLQDLQRADASITRVREALAWRSQLTDGTATLPPGALAVEFAGVTFGYGDGGRGTEDGGRRTEDGGRRTEEKGTGDGLTSSSVLGLRSSVLNNVSFTLAPGRVLGLLGRTGSGKTTIARLLFRLYDPQDGAVRLGGVDLHQASIAALRSRVGLVTQDVQIFAASLRDNLTFFGTNVDDVQLLDVLDTLQLGSWLARLPQGLDTPIAGGQLSAGEAQLIALARVFLQDPGLVILDEASARLDPATETLIEGALDRLLMGRTAIIIAHRLQSVERANDVLILQDGQVLEYGPRALLIQETNSIFATLRRAGLGEVLA